MNITNKPLSADFLYIFPFFVDNITVMGWGNLMRRYMNIFIIFSYILNYHFVAFAEQDKAGDTFKAKPEILEQIGNAANEASDRKNSADSDGLDIPESTNYALAAQTLMTNKMTIDEKTTTELIEGLTQEVNAINSKNAAAIKAARVAYEKILMSVISETAKPPSISQGYITLQQTYLNKEPIPKLLDMTTAVKIPIPADLTNTINFLKQYRLIIQPRRKYKTAIINGAEDFIAKKTNCTVNFKKANGSCGPRQSDTMKDLTKAMTAGNVLKSGLGVNDQCSITSGMADVASFGFLMYNFRCSSIRTMCTSSCGKAKQKANYLLQAVNSYKAVLEKDTENMNSCTFIAQSKLAPGDQKNILIQYQDARLKTMASFTEAVKKNTTECSAKYTVGQNPLIDSSFNCNSFTKGFTDGIAKNSPCLDLQNSCLTAQAAEKNYQNAYQNIKLQEKQNEMLIRINETKDGFTLHRMSYNPFTSGDGGIFKKEVPVTQLSNPMPEYSPSQDNPEGVDAPIQLGTSPVIKNEKIIAILKGACQNLKQNAISGITNLPKHSDGIDALKAEMNPQTKQGDATLSVSGKAKICESDYGGLLMNGLGMLTAMKNMKKTSEACKKATDAGKGNDKQICDDKEIAKNEFCKTCKDPKQAAMNPQCKCSEGKGAPECAKIVPNSLRPFTPSSVGPNAKPGTENIDPSKILEGLGAGSGSPGADNPGGGTAGGGGGVGGNLGGSAPSGGSSGGSGNGGGGSGSGGGGGGSGEEQTADILSGFQSGGGGGGGWGGGGGAGANSEYRDYLPGGAKDPESEQLQAMKEITPSGGKSLWEKVHERYQDNKKSFLD